MFRLHATLPSPAPDVLRHRRLNDIALRFRKSVININNICFFPLNHDMILRRTVVKGSGNFDDLLFFNVYNIAQYMDISHFAYREM